MARDPDESLLPPLGKVLSPRTPFPEGRTRQEVVIEELTELALKLKRPNTRPFYSMRDVAGFFKISLGTAALVFRALEKQGLLARVRGTHTVLIGKKVGSRDPVRGVIGISVWLPAMLALPYTATLTIELEERLRHYGYVADIIFHRRPGEDMDPEYASRLLKHRLDAVILHTPPWGSRQNIFSLRERGVRVIVLDGGNTFKGEIPAIIYPLNIVRPLDELASRWQAIGIRHVWLWSPLDTNAQDPEAELRRIFHAQGIELALSQDSPTQLLKKILRRKQKLDSAVIFGSNNENICNEEPQLVERISRVARLGFIFGRIHCSYLHRHKVPVDIVELPALEIAETLVADIQRLSVLPDGIRTTLVGKYYEQVIL